MTATEDQYSGPGGEAAGTSGRRGQIHTLEAFTASVILLAGLTFALGMTGTPTETESPSAVAQEAEVVDGLLDAAVENGTLRRTLLYWSESFDKFHGATEKGFYVARAPPTDFGLSLERTLPGRSVVFNLNLAYVADGRIERQTLVRQGDPGANAVRLTRSVTLYDGDVLYAADGSPTNTTLSTASSFYAPDGSAGPVYNVVRVEVIVWSV